MSEEHTEAEEGAEPDLSAQDGGGIAPPEQEDGEGAGAADSEADADQGDAGHHVYDFRRPARISKDRKRSLEAIYGLFVKSFEGWLAGRTRAPIHLSLAGLEQLTFGEFQRSLTSPCAAYSLQVDQSPAHNAVVDIGSVLGFYLMDRLSGGPGRDAGLDGRALTVMERQVIRVVAQKAASQLSEVWGEYAELDLAVTSFESIPDMLRAASREDPYLVANLDVKAGDVISGMTIALPFSALDDFFAANTSRTPPSGSSPALAIDRKAVEGTLRSAGVDLSVRLPTFTASFEQLAGLAPGALLRTTVRRDSDVEVIINGQTRYRGRPGRSGPRLAVEVVDVLEEHPGKGRRRPYREVDEGVGVPNRP